MIPLILGILSSAFIFVLFRIFPKYNVDTFQAIVFNYFTAFTCGFLLYGNQFKASAFADLSWAPYVVASGVLFIALFLTIGISAQKNGVAITSVSTKMSMSMTMILMIIAYSESLSGLKITGIILAITGVLAMSWPTKNTDQNKEKPVLWLLFFLFIGSGVLDFILNYVQKYHQSHLPSSLYSAIGFGVAGLVGISILGIQIARKKHVFAWRNVLAGILLGIPNYFSIYLLLLSYSTTGWNDSTVLAITNVSVVLLAAFIGFIVFKERFTALKLVGLIAALAAITTLYLASIQ